MKKTLIGISAAAAFALPFAVQAVTTGSASFSAVDMNNDGSISRAEWDAYHARGTQTPGNRSSTRLPSPHDSESGNQ